MKQNRPFLKISLAAAVAAAALLCSACSAKNSAVKISGAEVKKGAQKSSVCANFGKTLDQAIDIALADAGVPRSVAKFSKTQRESGEDGFFYDIEFIVNDKKYEYKISVASGEIVENETDPVLKRTDPDKKTFSKSGGAPKTSAKDARVYIGADDAKKIAVKNAGVNPDGVVFKKASFELDDGIPSYDIEFYSNDERGYEYEYKICAESGKVLEFDKEFEKNKAVKKTSDKRDPDYISESEAKAIAMKLAGAKLSDARFFECDFESDSALPRYEIEFDYGGYRYEFDINAKTGALIAFDKEKND